MILWREFYDEDDNKYTVTVEITRGYQQTAFESALQDHLEIINISKNGEDINVDEAINKLGGEEYISEQFWETYFAAE